MRTRSKETARRSSTADARGDIAPALEPLKSRADALYVVGDPLANVSAAPVKGLGSERVDEGASLRLRGDPFVLHAHPPARLGVRVID